MWDVQFEVKSRDEAFEFATRVAVKMYELFEDYKTKNKQEEEVEDV